VADDGDAVSARSVFAFGKETAEGWAGAEEVEEIVGDGGGFDGLRLAFAGEVAVGRIVDSQTFEGVDFFLDLRGVAERHAHGEALEGVVGRVDTDDAAGVLVGQWSE